MHKLSFSFLLCMGALFSNANAFVVTGRVEDMGHRSIAGAEIYETYSDAPVAVTDADGKFRYETGSATPVQVFPVKQGYWSEHAPKLINQDTANSDITLTLNRWYEKQTPTTVYLVHSDDKTCLLNMRLLVEDTNHGIDDTVNNYNPTCLLGGGSCFNGSKELYPNPQGGIIIPHLVPSMMLRRDGYMGTLYSNDPGDVIYYKIAQPIIDRGWEVREERFEWEKEQWGKHKEYETIDDYKVAWFNNVYKFCPQKLSDALKETKNTSKDSPETQSAAQALADAKAAEQSLANRMVTAGAIGATGVGGMMLASGLSEKKADEAAEQDMAAWLATMKCDYGRGLNITGGETGIELPGGNELMDLYTEFKELAADLKERKDALGLKPGLESEVILDKSQIGLYDDVGIGITTTAFTSVSQALTDPDGEAAAAWSEQKEAAAKNVKAGAITAGVGAAVGIVGNVLINGKLGQAIKNKKDKKDKENEEISDDDALAAVPAFQTEPSKCTYSECLARLTISDRTRAEPYYKTITDFCARQFPGNDDCIKIMLMYLSPGGANNAPKDIDTLVANNYDIDYYKRLTTYDCDDYVCADDDPSSKDTVLYSDKWYKFRAIAEFANTFNDELRKCFKAAGALDYFDINLSLWGAKEKINIDNVDCTKLDDGKSETDTHVRGNNVRDVLQDLLPSNEVLDRLKQLFGNQANLIQVEKFQ